MTLIIVTVGGDRHALNAPHALANVSISSREEPRVQKLFKDLQHRIAALIRIDKDCGLPLLSPPSHISVPTGTSALGESSLLLPHMVGGRA